MASCTQQVSRSSAIKPRLVFNPLSEPITVSCVPRICIREGSIEEVQRLTQIIQYEAPQKTSISAAEIRNRCSCGCDIVVAELDGTLVGGAIMFHEGKDAYIGLSAFEKKGNGLSADVMKVLMRKAFASGFDKVVADISIDDEAMLSLFANLEFTISARVGCVYRLERPLIVDMSHNTFPYTPNCVRDAVSKLSWMQWCEYSELGNKSAGMQWHQYSEIEDVVRKQIAAFEKVLPENIMLVSNGTDAINLIISAFRSKDFTIIKPTFWQIEKVSKSASSVTTLKIEENGSIANIEVCRNKVVFLCNPNNPTGRLISREQIMQISGIAEVLIIDEAYMHFVNDSAAHLIGKKPIIIIKTLSKFGCALGQVGILIADRKMLDIIPADSSPTHSSLVIASSVFSSDGVSEIRKICDEIAVQREFLRLQLALLGYSSVESFTNFLFVKERLSSIAEFLGFKGIYVKRLRMDDQGYMRITVRSDWENAILLDAIADYQSIVS